jgi:hypothetical protein
MNRRGALISPSQAQENQSTASGTLAHQVIEVGSYCHAGLCPGTLGGRPTLSHPTGVAGAQNTPICTVIDLLDLDPATALNNGTPRGY